VKFSATPLPGVLLIDLDAYKAQPAMNFPKDRALPNFVSGNGMMNTKQDAKDMNIAVGKWFGYSEPGVYIRNDHGFMIGDIFQAIGNVLGDIDKPAYEMAVAIKKAVADKGLAFVVCHSQGSAYFEQSLKLLPPEVRARVFYLGLGPQQIIDEPETEDEGTEKIGRRRRKRRGRGERGGSEETAGIRREPFAPADAILGDLGMNVMFRKRE